MPQLIGFRTLQGLGGGGLMVLSMAIVGDLVPPRERGRYQGLFGAVFGATSVLGPLLGGVFTEHLSWRWVFYVNVPLGAVALVVIAAALHIPTRPARHVIDYLGTFLIAAVAACLVLAASLGGTTWAWGSPRSSVWRCSPSSSAPGSSGWSAGPPNRCCRCGSSASTPSPCRR